MTPGGKYLSKKMAAAGITTAQLTKHLGLKSESNVAEWLSGSGSRHIPVHHIAAIAAFVPGCGRETLRNKVEGKAPKSKQRAAKKEVVNVSNEITVTNGLGDPVKWRTIGVIPTVQPINPGTNVHWYNVKDRPIPSDKAHWRFNGKEVYIIRKENAVHAPHADVTHWAEFQYPNPPVM